MPFMILLYERVEYDTVLPDEKLYSFMKIYQATSVYGCHFIRLKNKAMGTQTMNYDVF